MTVSEYFSSLGITLSHPEWVCVETAKGAAYPIELCYIIPGQPMRKCIPPDLVHTSLDFMQKAPHERLNSIMAGSNILHHNTSEYMRAFGMTVDPSPQKCLARMLKAPLLDYGDRHTDRPANGAWNFKDRKLYEPVEIPTWAVISYKRGAGVDDVIREVIDPLVTQATRMGIHITRNPLISLPAAQSLEVAQHLLAAGQQVFHQYRVPPKLLVVVLPENSADLYQAVKHFGDVTVSFQDFHQTLAVVKLMHAAFGISYREELRLNASRVWVSLHTATYHDCWISDPSCPVMIISTHVMHPAPGAHGRPSFVGAVGSLDSNAVRYTALNQAQDSRVEMIHDLESIVYEFIGRHAWWKTNLEKQTKSFPERIIYYQSGVSGIQVLLYERA
ncbi:argonaute-like protein, partial [Rhizoctonia solani AG-3 Rhs1AP]